MKQKLSIIELWRFIACLCIVIHHSFYLGLEKYSFSYSGYIYVEFFLLLTGYFSISHFDKSSSENNINGIARESFRYTIKKFSRLIPYTSLAIFLEAIVVCFFIKSQREGGLFLDMILEMTLVHTNYLIPPLWFISALIIIFPLFCCLLQIKSRYFMIITFLFYSVYYYRACGVNGLNTAFPMYLFRVLAGLMLGALIYCCSEELNKKKISRITSVVLTVVEEVLMIFVLYSTYKNKSYFTFMLLCMIVALIIMASGLSYTSKFKMRLINFLGNISMIIYVFHKFIADILIAVGVASVYVYVGSCILASVILYFLVEYTLKWIFVKKK